MKKAFDNVCPVSIKRIFWGKNAFLKIDARLTGKTAINRSYIPEIVGCKIFYTRNSTFVYMQI